MYLLKLCLLPLFLLAFPGAESVEFTGEPLHDYHISKTNVRYVADAAEVQVEMHLFVDDLEADLANAGVVEKLEIGTKLQHPDAERYLTNYLKQHFQVNWNGQPLALEIVGYELDDDLHGLWIYQLAKAIEVPESVTVQHTAMTNTYADQKNIVKLYDGPNRTATLLLSKDRPAASYEQK